MTIHNSDTDLGWTNGANVSTELASFFSATYVSGDTLLLAGVYELTSTQSIPASATISATNGNGFDMGSGMTNNAAMLLVSANDVTIDNVTFTASSAPVWASYDLTTPQAGTDFQNSDFIEVGNVTGFHCVDCDFQDQVNAAIVLLSTNAPVIEYCRFYRNKFPFNMQGDVRNFVLRSNFVEECISEGIKTTKTQGSATPGPNNGSLINMTFFKVNRSCYDTTGGWMTMTHTNDRVAHANELYDLKTPWDNDGDEKLNHGCRDLVVNGGHVFGCTRVAVITQNQNATTNWMTAQEWTDYGPRNLVWNDMVVESKAGYDDLASVTLEKAGTGIVWNDTLIRNYDPTPTLSGDAWSANVGGGNDPDPPSGWDQTITPTDAGPSGNTAFNNSSTGAASGVDPTTWSWSKKPATTSARLVASSGGGRIVSGGVGIRI